MLGQMNKNGTPSKKKAPMDIPPHSPLGIKLAQWEQNPDTKNNNSIKIIHYCMI